MKYSDYFRSATGHSPYPYQSRLVDEDWPDILDVPTGLGKTAAVTLAWLYRRRILKQDSLPRRLVWCLPMRVLVEQTRDNIQTWLEQLELDGKAGADKTSVQVLMGGEPGLREADWAQNPQQDAILIGTQDMLLSRALMRGYGMSRYQWPIHFSLLHNDCLWVLDEVQLMGTGLTTSAQLEAFRRDFPLARSSRTLWVSATFNRNWLDTIDLRPHLDSLLASTIDSQDRTEAGDRLNSVKSLTRAPIVLTGDAANKPGLKAWLEAFRDLVLDEHDVASQTLVIVNRVDRAQQLFRLLREHRPDAGDLLIHGRFRAAERAEQLRRLTNDPETNRIIVATQAIEAGVDISSKTLVTELAPWSSMVQRFGRCNRYGEHNQAGARILWLDIEEHKDLVLPYTAEALAIAREKLAGLASAASSDLPATNEPRALAPVLRRKDLLDLFNTDPDLSGFDVDVADWIRDTDTPGVQLFWRQFKDDPNHPEPQPKPARNELCPVSIGQAKQFDKVKGVQLWTWDALEQCWSRRDRAPRPGMLLLASAASGGYDAMTGFDPSIRKPPVSVLDPPEQTPESFGEDWRSRQKRPVMLTDHLSHVADHARRICNQVGEKVHSDAVTRAARWHDLGKAHHVFDATMHACDQAPKGLLAKSPCNGRHERKFFRHELASMLAWLEQHDGEQDADLIAYLIVAHHGKVRMSLRSMPTEAPADNGKRFARGIWEDDPLPALDFDGESSRALTLRLALMEIGLGEQGPSWTERALGLLKQHGPFQLAWLETLVRLADWRASAEEQET